VNYTFFGGKNKSQFFKGKIGIKNLKFIFAYIPPQKKEKGSLIEGFTTP